MKKNTMNNDNLNKVAFKAGTWYMFSAIITKAIMVISTPVFTRLMSKEEYGMVTTFMSWCMLLLPVVTANLSYSIGRAKQDYENQFSEYVGSMQVLSFFISVIFSVIILLFFKQVQSLTGLNEKLIILLILYLIFMPAINFAQERYRYQYLYKQNIAIALYISVATIGLSLLLVLLTKLPNEFSRALGVVIPAVVLSTILWYKEIKRKTIRINYGFFKYGLYISSPLVLHTISLNILAQSDVIFITKFCGTADTAVYNLAYSYGLMITALTSAIADSWLPWFHDQYYMEKFKEIRVKIKPLIIFGCYLALACIAFAPEAMLVLGGKKYLNSVGCVIPIVLGVLCQFIYTHYVNIEMHLKKTINVSIGTILAASINIVLNIIFIPQYGFVAAAYTTLVGYAFLLLFHYYITKYVLKVHLYKDRFMFGAIVITMVMSVCIGFSYKHTVIRICIIILGFISFLICFREQITEIFRKGK